MRNICSKHFEDYIDDIIAHIECIHNMTHDRQVSTIFDRIDVPADFYTTPFIKLSLRNKWQE